ncbi:uncharacterized protein LOC133462831 [Cololabis saira]|uniref:uncharacterized protein LOC133462831 n=1 Tax=Cololabis saira TaxID=129043 RepID=UPI002AD48F05|nr:uncharacterized protein LOC133462831 [Cololabis saira]
MEVQQQQQQLKLAMLGFCYLAYKLNTRMFERRLRAAKRNSAEKRRRLLAWVLRRRERSTWRRRQRRRRQQILALFWKRRRRPVAWAFSRASDWWDVTVPGFTHTQWLHHFRMSEGTFSYLCERLRPAMEKQDTSFRACVPLRKRVAIALWKLATNSEYRRISDLFGVSITLVCRCVQDFSKAVCTMLLPEVIRFPDQEKLQELADHFENRWGLPQCVGAIDASLVPIIAPRQDPTDYVNGNGGHSLVLQGVVDRAGLFWSVTAGTPVSFHDTQLLRSSPLWDWVGRGGLHPACTKEIGGVGVGYYVLGGSPYPLQNWLMTPFPENRLTAEQQTYNRKTSGARAVAADAFRRLKGRWKCLLKRNGSDVELVKSMVLTCCALHNLCDSRGEDYQQEWDTSEDEPGLLTARDVEEDGREVRDGLMRHLNTE